MAYPRKGSLRRFFRRSKRKVSHRMTPIVSWFQNICKMLGLAYPDFLAEETVLCRRCGYQGHPAPKPRGYTWLEILLWICFLVPGWCYAWWRRSNAYEICRMCGYEKVSHPKEDRHTGMQAPRRSQSVSMPAASAD